MQSFSKLKTDAGFTMIEVLVASALMAIAMSLTAVIFLGSFTGQRKVIAAEQAYQNARILIDTLSREIRTSTICGDTGGIRECADPANNTPTIPASSRSRILDIIRNLDGVHVSYCFKDIIPTPPDPNYYEIWRLVQAGGGFGGNPCTDPASQLLQSPEVVLLIIGSGFITRGVGQTGGAGSLCPGVVYDLCQPRVTIMLKAQSITQKVGQEKSEVSVQTTISQRLFDVP